MCTPIFPNTDHPAGRPPVHTEPPFPFTNCCHWFGPGMVLEVRVKIATDEEICGPVDGEPPPSGPDRMPPQIRRKFGFMGMMARMQVYDVWRVEEMERMYDEAVRMQFSAELPDVEVNLFPSTPSDRLENSKHTLSSSLQKREGGTCQSVLPDHSASGDAEYI